MQILKPCGDAGYYRRQMSDLFLRLIASHAAGLHKGKQIAIAADSGAQAQQVLFNQGRLRSCDRQCGGVANGRDGDGVMAQPLQLSKDGAQRPGARLHRNLANCLDSLGEGERMSEGRGAGEALGKQQRAVDRLTFGNLLDATKFVEEARDGADDFLAHGLKKEMRGLGEIGKHGSHGH